MMNAETVSRPCANEDLPHTAPDKTCLQMFHSNSMSDAVAENAVSACNVLDNGTEKGESVLDENRDEQSESSNNSNGITDTNDVATLVGDDWVSGASSEGMVSVDGRNEVAPSSQDIVLDTQKSNLVRDAADIPETVSVEKPLVYDDPEGVDKSILEGGQSPITENSNNHEIPNSQRTDIENKEVNVSEVRAYDGESISEHSDVDSNKEGSMQQLFSCGGGELMHGSDVDATDEHEEKCPRADTGGSVRDETVLHINTGDELLKTNHKEEVSGNPTDDNIGRNIEKSSDVDMDSGDGVDMEGVEDDLLETGNKEKDTLEESRDRNDKNLELESEFAQKDSDADRKVTADRVEGTDAGEMIEPRGESDVVEPSGGDAGNVGGWQIEICDVRTVSLEDEDMETDEGAIIDLEQSDELSYSTGSQDEFLSPRPGFAKSDGSLQESENVASRSVPKPAVQVENVDDDNKYSDPILEENETNSNLLPKHSPKGNKSSTVQSILEQENKGTDVLQHMYMQTSTLHDPELSTINTSGSSLASINNEDTLKNVSASDLLSELAENVKNIKSEPQDPQYDKAFKCTPKAVDKKPFPELQNMSLHEMLRLPVNMQALPSSEGTTNNAPPEQPVNSSVPPSRLVQCMQIYVDAEGNVLNRTTIKPNKVDLQSRSTVTPALKTPVANSRQQIIVHPDGSKTVTYLVPVQNNDKKGVFVSVPVPGEKGSKPKNLVKVKSKAKRNQTDKMLYERFDFKQYLVDCMMKYTFKSVDVSDICNFLQRKNSGKVYKPEKPPGQLDFSFTQDTCLECGDQFACDSSLECHMARCSMKISFRCNDCRRMFTFSNKCQLLSHIRHDSNLMNPKGTPTIKINSDLIHIVTPSQDDICNNSLVKETIVRFSPIDLPTQRVKCLMCKQGFANEKALKVHFGSTDLICSFAYQCFQCDMVMPRLCALSAHRGLHKSTTAYICPECGKPFTDASFFSRHIRDECLHTSRVYLIECPMCLLKLEGLVVARKHIMEKHSKVFYKCPICIVAYDKLEILKKHVRENHAGQQIPYEAVFINSCPFGECSSLFHNGKVLEKHVDTHISGLKKNAKYGYKCLDCGEGTSVHSRKATLIAHTVAVHKKIFKAFCNCCGMLFNTCEDADRHRQIMHVDQPHFTKTIPYVNSATDVGGKKKVMPIQPKPLEPVLVTLCDRCKVFMPKNIMNGNVCADSVRCFQANMLKSKPFPVQLVSPVPIKSVEDKHSYFCLLCHMTIPGSVHYKDHMATCHPKEKSKEPEEPEKNNRDFKYKPAAIDSKHTFSCNFCHVRFPNEKRLKIHVKDHGNSGFHVCSQCNLVAFKSMEGLRDHQSKCTHYMSGASPPSAEEDTCVVCNHHKISKHLLIDHLKSHASKGILVCCHCQKKEFVSKEDLHAHQIECGRVDYPLEHGHCYTCQKSFPTLEQLVMHLQDHVRDGTFICCKCQSVFLTQKLLKGHHDVCGKEQLKSSHDYCTLCRKTFPNERQGYLYRHITQHVIKGALICCVCQKMGWKSFSEVKSHQIICDVLPEPEYQYKCKVCGSGFADSDELSSHLKWHSQHQFLVCFKCQKRKFKSRRAWRRHESRCRNNLDESSEIEDVVGCSSGSGYVTMDNFCDHCGKRFHSSSLLQEHIAEQHQTFPCHLCGLTYQSKEELVLHISFNHDCKITYISCHLCKAKKIDKRFASQVGLDLHMIKMHKRKQRSGSTDMKDSDKSATLSPTASVVAGSESSATPPMKRLRVTGDSNYTCAKCTFVTENNAEFSEHIKGHKTGKDNQCPDCGLCFAIVPALKKHLFMVHKVRNSEEYLQEKGLRTEDDELDSDAEDVHPELKRSRWTNSFDTMASGLSKPKKIKQESSEDEEGADTGNPLECRVCYKTFENDKQLKTHMRTHGMAFIKATKRSAKKGASLAKVSSPCKSDASAASSKSEEAVTRTEGATAGSVSTIKPDIQEQVGENSEATAASCKSVNVSMSTKGKTDDSPTPASLEIKEQPDENSEATAASCKSVKAGDSLATVNLAKESSDEPEKLKGVGIKLLKEVVVKQEILDDGL